MVYYNEFDPKNAAWLRQLISEGLIAKGEVDERDIREVSANDVRGYVQHHWFAGIGGWSLALRLAGWDDARPVWTASLPCQPFSIAGEAKAKQMNATFGLFSENSSATESLQSSLENRLRARLEGYGSPEYDLTWKVWDMRSGPPICALRASQRHISDKDFTGYPTPRAEDAESSGERIGRGVADTLTAVARMAGWASPTAQDHSRGDKPPRPTDTGIPLSQQAAMFSGWSTPSSRDWKDTPGMATTGTNPDGSTRSRTDQLPRQAHGAIGNCVTSQTGKRGALNPGLSRWLMAYPHAWCDCAVTAMRLFQSSRQNSSKPISKLKK